MRLAQEPNGPPGGRKSFSEETLARLPETPRWACASIWRPKLKEGDSFGEKTPAARDRMFTEKVNGQPLLPAPGKNRNEFGCSWGV